MKNDECDDLDLRKIYQALPDKRALRDGYIRIVDESGEDYLYPDLRGQVNIYQNNKLKREKEGKGSEPLIPMMYG